MTDNPTRTVGEALVDLIVAAEISTVFGIPGVHSVDLYRGLVNRSLRHVLPRHEQGAGFMADGYARATGRPAACFVITGPGVTNIATAMGQAMADSVPMLVVATTLDRGDLGRRRGRLHEITDQRAVAAPLSVAAFTLDDPLTAPAVARAALARLHAGRPGPVYLEVPLDVLRAPALGDWTADPPPLRPAPDTDAIKAAAAHLAKAQRPCLLAGGGAVFAGQRITALAERLNAPVITTTAGKGTLPFDHPFDAGTALATEAGQHLLAESDLVLVVGSGLSETDSWGERLRFGGTVIRVDVAPDALADPWHPADLSINGDAAVVAGALLTALGNQPTASSLDAAAKRAASVRAAEGMAGRPLADLHRKALAAVRKALPDHALFVSDMTQSGYAAVREFPIGQPSRHLHPSGYGTLGFALPAAIGAAIAAPDRPVVALEGDYGFQFTAPELATAVQEGVDLCLILWDNAALGEIRDDMTNRGVTPVATNVVNPDLVRLTEAYGATAERVGTADALHDAVVAAGRRGGVNVVVVDEAQMIGSD